MLTFQSKKIQVILVLYTNETIQDENLLFIMVSNNIDALKTNMFSDMIRQKNIKKRDCNIFETEKFTYCWIKLTNI